jgi:nucleotide-binding universal stress UspA family protein
MHEKIMVPLDGSDRAASALPHVKALASGSPVKQVVLVRVVDPIGYPTAVRAHGEFGIPEKNSEQIQQERKKAFETYLQEMEKQLNTEGLQTSSAVLEGEVAETLIDYATKNSVDLIVMTTHGRSGISRWLLGSVADRMVSHSCVPVLLVRAPGCEPRRY